MQKHPQKTLANETGKLVNSIIKQGVDLIVGGWPCQNLSLANNTDPSGLSGPLSGLFWQMAQTIRMVRPCFVLLENVAGLLARGMGDVLAELASGGYDCEWDCISAGALGAPHHRARIYILAHNSGLRGQRLFPETLQRQPEFLWLENVRSIEDLPQRSDLYPSQLCRSRHGTAKRLHMVGNGNSPAVMRVLGQQIIKAVNGYHSPIERRKS